MLKRAYIEITNVCNLRCSFCPGTRRQARFMTAEEFRTLAQKLRGHTDYLYFHVLGEPLLHPALPQLLNIAGELGFRVCLTTNGTLLPQQLDTLLHASALHKISVSLHSFEANDSQISLTDYLDGVWQSCLALSANGVLCALRLWNDGGLDAQNDNILYYLSEKIQYDIKNLPTDRRGNRTLRPRIFLERAEKFDWPDPEAPEAGVQFCHGLRQQIAVLCDGTVVPCCLDGEGNIPLGNLFSQELCDILSAPRAAAMRDGFARRQPTEALCRRCGYASRFSK
ncbi:MAG: radical SAM protein [Clostridiales bacterium]|nr:radical SAM protein [Candidatus Cacconaster stercorequi]